MRLRTTMLTQWRREARGRLPALQELVRSRHELIGELAHLSVPDLKEAGGGLRDATVLKALVASWLVDVPHVDLERSRLALLDVRDVLHGIGRSGDRPGGPGGVGRPGGRSRPSRRDGRPGARPRAGPTHHPPRPSHVAAGRRGAGPTGLGQDRPDTRAHPDRGGSGAGLGRGRARRPGAPRPGPTAAAPGCRRGGRARRRARAGHGRPAGARGRAAAGPLARGRPSAAGPAARLGTRPAGGVGDPGGDRRAAAPPPRVGPDPAAAARLGHPPVHRRPPCRRDLHRGLGADPACGPPGRAHGRRAAARHRQGRPDRAQRRR